MQQQQLLVPFFFPLSLNKKLSSLLFVKEEAAAAAAAEGAETHVHNKTPRDVVEMCDLPETGSTLNASLRLSTWRLTVTV